jgi:hypothetical protein
MCREPTYLKYSVALCSLPPSGADSVFPIFTEVRMSATIHPLAHCLHDVNRFDFTTYFIQLLPDLNFRTLDLTIILIIICGFLTNHHRENKEHLPQVGVLSVWVHQLPSCYDHTKSLFQCKLTYPWPHNTNYLRLYLLIRLFIPNLHPIYCFYCGFMAH